MKKIISLLIFVQISLLQYGQIIADHRAVADFDNIPQNYIDSVKTMLVSIVGESHASGYRIGAELLELFDSRFQVTIYANEGFSYDAAAIPDPSDQYLRIGQHAMAGEYIYYISQANIDLTNSNVNNQNAIGNPFTVTGFGWCYDMTWVNDPGGTIDPVYNVHWAGSSENGPQGDLRWGLDSEDEALTGNSVCMDTYLGAVEQYIAYCESNNILTKPIFTTGPVDGYEASENGFQREIKHDYIRDYVSADGSRILFDYADILCWNNDGEENITNWDDNGTLRPHANIHPDNMKDYDASWNFVDMVPDGDHIGEVGAMRVAKAMWWMLARIAGWDGGVVSLVENNEIREFHITQLQDKLIINSDDRSCKVDNFYIYDLQGRLMDHKKNVNIPVDFDISSLESGIYIVRLTDIQLDTSMKVFIY